MGDWAVATPSRITGVATTANSNATQVDADPAANTKGAWVQLVASTPAADSLTLLISSGQASGHYLIDIGIGGAGSEQVLVADLMFSAMVRVITPVTFPLHIPAGSRLSARCQSRLIDQFVLIGAVLTSGGHNRPTPLSAVSTYGAVTGDSGGTLVNAGGTANTIGTIVQLTSATTRAHKGLIVAASRPDNTVTIAANYGHLANIYAGGAGSEQLLAGPLRYNAGVTSAMQTPVFLGPLPCDLPAGTRLSMAIQSSVTDAEDRTADFALYGLS